MEARKNLSLARSIVQGTRSKTISLFAEISDDLMRRANASNASRRIAKARRVLLSNVMRPLVHYYYYYHQPATCSKVASCIHAGTQELLKSQTPGGTDPG